MYRFCHLAAALVTIFKLLGLRISLSKMLTICSNFGLLFLSFCQQSSIIWYKAAGQSMGGGKRYPSSTALITCTQGRQFVKPEGHSVHFSFLGSENDMHYIIQCGGLVIKQMYFIPNYCESCLFFFIYKISHLTIRDTKHDGKSRG